MGLAAHMRRAAGRTGLTEALSRESAVEAIDYVMHAHTDSSSLL